MNTTQTTKTTAADTLIAATREGMEVNGWSFDQAMQAAVAAMIAEDADTMREFIACFA